jgi:methylenetetrahydrofolate reductase (NADPH)
MKVVDYIKESKKPLFSFEIIPPLKGKGIEDIYAGIDPLIEFGPKFVNVTYHREEYKYKEMGDGLLKKISIRKRPGTVGICAAIMNKYKVDAVPHLICGGFNVEDTENALIDLKFLGIDNILALRGDPIKTEQIFQPNKGGHEFAIDLINQIGDMNRGKYLDDDHKNSPTDFCIGCAGYPEKHFEAMNLESDMAHLKAKVDAGAEYITTQLFYDNDKYFEFVDKCRAMGINVPIIPGLKPITNLTHKTFLPKFFHIDFPMELSKELDKCKTNADVNQLGIEWGINQVKDLISKGVPVVHFYTMGKGEAVKSIAREIF